MKKHAFLILILIFLVFSCSKKNYSNSIKVLDFQVIETTYNNEFVKDERASLSVTLSDEEELIKEVVSLKINNILYSADTISNISISKEVKFEVSCVVKEEEFVLYEIAFKNHKNKTIYANYKNEDINASIVLKDFKITFHYNNGSDVTFDRRYDFNTEVRFDPVSTDDIFYEFKVWNTQSSGIGKDYNAYIKYTFNSEVANLYAIWKTTVFYHTDNIEFNLVGDEYEVKALNKEISGLVVIPQMYNNLPVTMIADEAFSDATQVARVMLPNGIKHIGVNAFKNATKLSEINIPSSLESIGAYAFSQTQNIRTITINSNIVNIGERAFEGWASTSVIIIENLENASMFNPYWKHGSNASFLVAQTGDLSYFNFSLKSDQTYEIVSYNGVKGNVVIPSTHNGINVTSIADEAFNNATEVISITIPSTLTQIGNDNFLNCNNLERFIVSEDNMTLSTYKGDLYSKSLNSLIKACPRNKEYQSFVLPEETVAIETYAFANCVNILKLEIPSTIEYIGKGAFHGFTSGQQITMIGISSAQYGWDEAWNLFCNATIKWDYLVENPGFVFKLNSNNTYSIVGINANYLAAIDAKNLVIPTTHKGLIVTRIEKDAILDFALLETLEIPETILEIDAGFVYNCINLVEINVSEDNPNYVTINKALYNKEETKLIAFPANQENIIIPDTVNTIGAYAFAGYQKMIIYIPSHIIYIENSAFYYLTSNQMIILNDRYEAPYTFSETWLNSFFGNVVYGIPTPTLNYELSENQSYYIVTSAVAHAYTQLVIPDTYQGLPVIEINDFAFRNDVTIRNISMGRNIEIIGKNAFDGCSNLRGIDFKNNNNLRYIREYAFRGCINLTAFTVPENVIVIEDYAFSYTGIELFLVNSYVEVLTYKVFYEANNLKEIIVSSNNLHLASYEKALFTKDLSMLIVFPAKSTVENFTTPLETTVIMEYAFNNAINLLNCNLQSVVEIKEGAFTGCIRVSSITLSEDLTTIGDYAFTGCANILNINIPISVTSIGKEAFKAWTNIQTIELNKTQSESTLLFDPAWRQNSQAVVNYLSS